MLWRMQPDRPQVPHAIVAKFRGCVHCLALCERADACVACSRCGEVVAVALSTGAFLRKVRCDIGEPTHAAVWPDGTVAVAFAASNRSAVALFDQNLGEIARTVLPSAVRAWDAVAWPSGKNFLAVAMASGRCALFAVPEMEEIWKIERMEFDLARIAVSTEPLAIVAVTACGKVLALPFDAERATE
jgi:hypothetical protein